MTFAPFGPLNLKPIYKELELLDIDQLFSLEKAKFMYKKEKSLLPTTIANYFEPVSRNEHTAITYVEDKMSPLVFVPIRPLGTNPFKSGEKFYRKIYPRI